MFSPLQAEVPTVPELSKNFGRLVSTHSMSPAILQRAAIVAAVSFVFFLGMLIIFYVRRHIGYFALSTAFLVVYVMTLLSWVMQKRNVVSIFENGIRYKKFTGLWEEIESATPIDEKTGGFEIRKNKREKVIIPSSIQGFDLIFRVIKEKGSFGSLHGKH